MEIYEIDLVRALFANKLNDPSIFLASFYEQIQDQEQITRYVDTIKDLIALQNREKSESDYKAMGIIAQAGDSEILNIKTNYIVPTNYSARFDIELADRDYVLGKIKALINDLRGRKFEVIQLANGNYVFPAIPTIDTATDKIINNQVNFLPQVNWTLFTPSTNLDITNPANDATLISDIVGQHVIPNTMNWTFYFIYNNKLWTRRISRTGASSYSMTSAVEVDDIEGQYKLSISFNGVQSQEPYINNGLDRVYIFFGGNVTITDSKVMLGNDIVQTTIQVGKDTGTIFNVEPNEIPASLALDTDGYGEWGTGYRGKERIIGVANKLSYSFIYDTTIALYNDLYRYSRFGVGTSQVLTSPLTVTDYANQEFTLKEYRYSYGKLVVDKFYAKLGEITTQNTNGDVMMLSVAFTVGAY
jgi:hypothetical protein